MSEGDPAPSLDERAGDVVRILNELAEHHDGTISEREVHEIPGARTLLSWGALKRAERAREVRCRECEREHFVEPVNENGVWIHFCSFVRVETPPEDINRFRMAPDWLPRTLTDVLQLPPTSCRPVVPDQVWELGQARTGERQWGAFFARRVGSRTGLEVLLHALKSCHHSASGLVLTTSRLPGGLDLPHGHRALHLAECLRVTATGLRLADAMLGRALQAAKRSYDPTRGRGRPGAKELYFEEHSRRLRSGDAFAELTLEAQWLSKWLARVDPTKRATTAITIRNQIRARHRAHFRTIADE